jgi:hypothetical protein
MIGACVSRIGGAATTAGLEAATMNVLPILLDWARGELPSIVAVFGSSLGRQIEAFNGIVERSKYSHDDIEVVFGLLAREFKSIHRPLLNTLSLFRDPAWSPGAKAMLLLLESYLRSSLDAGDVRRTYRDMLWNPQSYMELLAELDWACRLRRRGGTFRPHMKTHPDVPDDNTNYDLHWEYDRNTLLGDVKWFKDWLVKPRGEDLLRGQIWLLRPDLKHHIIVKARLRHWTPDRVLNAALSALELYQAALEGRRDPRWALARNRDRAQAAMKAAYYEFPPPSDLLVESVTVLLNTDRGSVSVVETGCSTGEDADSARRNIIAAASQIPESRTTGEVTCAFIGSAIPHDADDVHRALFGAPDGSGPPGMFDSRSTEPGYEHLNAVAHFSLQFEQAAADPHTVVVRRQATLFQGPKVMTPEQEAFLRSVLEIFHEESAIRVR